MGGVSSRTFKVFQQLCGDLALRNVVIATNMWGQVSQELGEAREHKLRTSDEFFKPALDKHARLLRHHNTAHSALSILRNIVNNRPEPMRIQRELVDERRHISQTVAALELDHQIMEQIQRHREGVQWLRAEHEVALRVKDEETAQELEETQRHHEATISRLETEQSSLASRYEDRIGALAARMDTARMDPARMDPAEGGIPPHWVYFAQQVALRVIERALEHRPPPPHPPPHPAWEFASHAVGTVASVMRVMILGM
jgi:hypothetical protein